MTTIGKLFQTNPKMQLFYKAYLFNEVNMAFKELFTNKYKNLAEEFKTLLIRVKESGNQVLVTVVSPNLSLITSLKIDTNFTQIFIKDYLLQKEAVSENAEIKTYFVSR